MAVVDLTPRKIPRGLAGLGMLYLSASHRDSHGQEQEQKDENAERGRQFFEGEPTVVAGFEGEINEDGRSTLLTRMM